jgi:polyhydroxybutyrate depolymerase
LPDDRPRVLTAPIRPRSFTKGLALVAIIGSALVACSGRPARNQTFEIAGRPVHVQVPSGYDEARALPLVMILHGFGSSAQAVDDTFHLSSLVDEYDFLYLRPEGSLDCEGRSFWDATEVCCDFCGVDVDDAGYLRGAIVEASERFNVDDRRIYLVGHSNGGFMALRMACDHADLIAGVANLAGAGSSDPGACTPSEPIHWLQIHGTADERIHFRGGIVRGRVYPGAVKTARQWAAVAGCALEPERVAEKLDLVEDLDGAETSIARFETGCNPGGSATLWTIEGGIHSPLLSRDFGRQVLTYLLAHPKRPTVGSSLDRLVVGDPSRG